MVPPVIAVRHVSKSFRIPTVRRETVREQILNAVHPRSFEELHVLDDISFEVHPGETLGIMGRNGSGKSTLLKILCGIYQADAGTVVVHGGMTPVLELGVGWNPELNAVDNILLVGTFMGLTLAEARRSVDEILRFAGLERFACQYLKYYSSGMAARLAYALALKAAREVLVLDEVFAVGDAEFRARCEQRYRELRAEGRTLLLVSHEPRLIEEFCDRALLLEAGKIASTGPGADTARAYMSLMMGPRDPRADPEVSDGGAPQGQPAARNERTAGLDDPTGPLAVSQGAIEDEGPVAEGAPRTLRAASIAWVCAAVLSLTLPFLGKALNIDDEVYVRGAGQILREPLHPLAGTQKMLGEVMPTYHFTQHPPFVSYYIALVEQLTGSPSEAPWHLAFLPFALLAALSMLILAHRFTRSPVAATLLLLTTPAFLVMAHGLMTEVPFLAFALAASALLVRGVDRRHGPTLMIAGALLSLACFVQYRGLLLVPLLWTYAWLQGRARLASLWALAAPVVLSGLWCLYNWTDIGVVHIWDAGSWIEFRPMRMAGDATAYTSYLGGATLSPLVYIWAARRQLGRPALLVTLAGLATLATATFARGYAPGQKALVALFLASGLAALLSLWPGKRGLTGAFRRVTARQKDFDRDELFLLLMIAVLLLSQITLNLFASVRSLLIGLPFLVLVVVRRVEARTRESWRGGVLAVGIALTLVSGLAVSLADFQFAAADRDLARQALVRAPAGRGVWFFGEWGFRYYMEQAGYAYMTADGRSVADGDLVFMADRPWPAPLRPELAACLKLERTIPSERRFPLRTMSIDDHAGFYLNGYGLLPFSYSGAPVAGLRLYRVAAASAMTGGD